MLMDLGRERFTEATVNHLVAVAVLSLPYHGCPFATVLDRHLRASSRDEIGAHYVTLVNTRIAD